jgi:PKD repeat protein
MHTKYILSGLLLFFIIKLPAQYRYERYHSGFADRISLLKTENDGLAALLSSFGNVNTDVTFYKIDEVGDLTFGQYFGGNDDYEFGEDFVHTTDGHFAFIGHGNSLPNGGSDVYFGKFTQQGNLLWQYVFGEDITDFGKCITQTADDGFLLGGFSQNPEGISYYRSYLIKTDANGQAEWEKALAHNGGQEILDVGLLPTGDLIAVGYYWNPTTLNRDALIYFLSPNGDILQQIGLGGNGDEVIEKLLVTPDSTILITGHTESYGAGQSDFFISELNLEGQQLWTKILGSEMDEKGYGGMGLAMDSHDNIIIAAYQQLGPFADDRQGIFLKTSRQGQLLWTRLLIDATQPYDVAIMNNDDIVVAGGDQSFSFVSNFLFRANASGKTSCGRDSFLIFDNTALFLPVQPPLIYSITDINSQQIGPSVSGQPFLFNPLHCSNYCEVKATIEYDQSVVTAGEAVSFESNSTNHISQHWLVNGDSITNTSVLEYTFPEIGHYELLLVAADTICADTAVLQIETKLPVNAIFTYYQELMVLQFNTDEAVGENWYWTFGDGNTSTEPHPKHIYDSLGIYEVCLTMERNGVTDTYCETIIVEDITNTSFIRLDSLEGPVFFDATRHDRAVSCRDGGFAVVGYAEGSSSINYSLSLQKYRADGTVKWRSTIRHDLFTEDMFGYSLIECDDLGFLVGGEIRGTGSNDGILIARTDSVGTVLWNYNIEATSTYNAAYDMVQLPDRGFLVCGQRNSRAFTIRLDEFGQKLWYKEYFDARRGTALIANADGTFFMAANSIIGNILFLHLDDTGEIIQSTMYEVDGLLTNGLFSDPSPVDASFYMGARATLSSSKAAVLKFSAEGELLWYKFLQTPENLNNSFQVDILETNNEHLFASIGGQPYNYGMAAYLSPDATPIWAKRINLPKPTRTGRADLSYDGQLVLPGSISFGFYDVGWLAQIDTSGQICYAQEVSLFEDPSVELTTTSALTDSVIVSNPEVVYPNLINGFGTMPVATYCFNDLTCIPSAAFFYITTNNVLTTFNNSEAAESYLWDFGDGNSSTEETPEHVYTNSGTYTLCLSASNSCGTVTTCNEVNIIIENCAPEAAFSFSLPEPGVVNFFDQSTGAESWFWEFGDGNTSTDQNNSYYYEEGGTYTVCLTVENSCGVSMQCQDIFVDNCMLDPQFTFIQVDSMLTFTPVDTSMEVSWEWNFGDGTISYEISPVHIYEESGLYTVCLTISNDCSSTTFCDFVEVVINSDCAPVASFVYEQFGLVLSCIAESPNAVLWEWDFGDGNSSTEPFPIHFYDAPGIYECCLTVYNECGSDTTCETLEVADCTPTAAFSYEQSALSVDFIDESEMATYWYWDFGDENFSLDQHPTHLYDAPGEYEVCLLVDNNGCAEDMNCQLLTIVVDDVDEAKKENFEYRLWPNPASAHLNFTFTGATEVVIELMDVHGRNVLRADTNGTSFHRLDITRLPAGLYYYRLKIDGYYWRMGKVIKG